MGIEQYYGIAILIGAIGGLITVIGGTALQIATFIRQGKALEHSLEHSATLARLEILTNGQSEKLNQVSHDLGFAQGREDEKNREHEDPVPQRHRLG